MPDQSSQSVSIAAQPAEILAVIGDFPLYPTWAETVTSAAVLSEHPDGSADQVRFVVDAGVVQDDFVLAFTWNVPQLRVDWELVSARQQRAQNGSYSLSPRGRETEVVYTLTVDVGLALQGAFKRRAENAAMAVVLRSLKQRVEGGR